MTGYSYVNTKTDSPQKLAAKLFGNWTLYRLITDTNPEAIKDNLILAGIILFIPDVLESELEHTIQEGDSYESLSLDYYGTEHYSGKIFSENEGLILHENIGSTIIIPGLA